MKLRFALALLCALHFGANARSEGIPSDVSVALSASPTTDLAPGQIIDFTLSFTNHGSEPIAFLSLHSNDFLSEYDLSKNSNDCVLTVVTVDGDTFFEYYYSWLPTLFAEIAPGETRVCHFKSALSASAPPVVALTFRLGGDLVDQNPSNDAATVYLRRRLESIPFLSVATGLTLIGLIALIGIVGVRIRGRMMAK